MITLVKKAMRRFRKEEDGSVFMIEFVILMPVIFGMFVMSFDMSMYSLRQVQLDRGLDNAVRYIRLNTRSNITHDQIKQMVCDGAGGVGDCANTLRLEMVKVNPRNFTQMEPSVDCIDKSLPFKPERGFTLGKQHDLMLLRACMKFDPLIGLGGMGFNYTVDGSGQASMYAFSAFVQEPS